MESIAVVVPKKKAEQLRKRLMEKGALRTDLQVASDSKNVYFPISMNVDFGYELVTRSFRALKQQPTDYRELLDMPEELEMLLPSSLDIIGHVAIVRLPDELRKYRKKIGRAIAKVNKPVKTVCLDSGVRGEERTRDLEIIYGSTDTLTSYREHNLVFSVDPRTMFFSPRLATERKLVADQVRKGERVFDMFAGVGPFTILIAKTSSPEMVYACDINEVAFQLLKENIEMNKVMEVVKPFLGDVREIYDEIPPVHRIIMNLPHSAVDFLDIACERLLDGGFIHFYDILAEDELEDRMNAISCKISELGRAVENMNGRMVKSYSPTLRYYGFDISFK